MARVLHGQELRAALDGPALRGLTLTPGPGGVWLLTGVDPDELLPVWWAARERVPRTGRWPVAVLEPPYHLDPPRDLQRAVDDFTARVDAADPASVFPAWVNDLPETAEDLALLVGHRFPAHPELVERMVADLGDPTTEPAWDAWLYDRLLTEPDLRAEVHVAHLQGTCQWHRAERLSLALLPDSRGWLSPLFLSFHSCETPERASALAAVQRRWEADYGAELVAHLGTMLELTVSRPPADPADAYRLAGEHKDIASSQEAYRYELALALPGSDAWFLHDRP